MGMIKDQLFAYFCYIHWIGCDVRKNTEVDKLFYSEK